MNKNETSIKPLTKLMIEVLMDCHERELLKLEPSEVFTVPSVSGLVMRGMVNTRSSMTQSGKKIIAVFITYAGKKYLNNLE